MLDSFFAYINNTTILSIIPLDSLLHFLVGAIISIIGLKYNHKIINIFFFLVAIGIVKELNDFFFAYPTHYFSYISDILASLIYIPLILLIRKIKKNLTTKNKKLTY